MARRLVPSGLLVCATDVPLNILVTPFYKFSRTFLIDRPLKFILYYVLLCYVQILVTLYMYIF